MSVTTHQCFEPSSCARSLLGLRLAARRPRRLLLSAASIAITVTMLVAVLAFHTTAGLKRYGGTSGLRDR
jgi:hypothetical protein